MNENLPNNNASYAPASHPGVFNHAQIAGCGRAECIFSLYIQPLYLKKFDSEGPYNLQLKAWVFVIYTKKNVGPQV